MRNRFLFILMLLGSLVLAACGTQPITAEEIVTRMEATRDSTNDLHATVAITFTTPEESGSMLLEGWLKKTGRTDEEGHPIVAIRGEVREASEAALVGSLVVSDGETFWAYNPTENTAITGTASEMKESAPTEPTGATQTLQEVIQEGLDAVDLEVLGEEQVAGKNTWKVRVTPKAETAQQLQLDSLITATMWVDSELAVPLKLDVDAADFGTGSLEVRAIELNTGLGDELFTFTPPPGTEIVQAADLAKEYAPVPATLEEARSSVSFTLLTPGYLPTGLALVDVRIIGTSTVILNYGGNGQTVSLVQSNAQAGDERQPPAGSSVQTVTVRGQQATLITGSAEEPGSLLRWQENGIRYVIAGTLSGDEAIAIAEGLQ
jgi:outer membrane lipoprotein-sorting protein